MRDTIWKGEVQPMVYPDGTPKGMKAVLEERRVDTEKMKAPNMQQKLLSYPDFKAQQILVQEYIESRGHKRLYYPKFHG